MSWDDEDEPVRAKERVRDDDDDGWQPFQPPAMRESQSGGVGVGVRDLVELATAAGPRDHAHLIERARIIGAMMGADIRQQGKEVASAAFYRWEISGKRGKSVVEGPTIDLMDALASEWGRLVYEVELLSMQGQQARLRGRVVDLVTIIVHQRDYLAHISPAPGRMANDPDQSQRWLTMQMQAAESKAIRGVLEHALPAWFVNVALRAAMEAFAKKAIGNSANLSEATKKSLGSFAKDHGIQVHELVAWLGVPVEGWVVEQLAALRELYRALKEGGMSVASFRAEAAARAALQAAEAAAEGPVSDDDLGLGSPAPSPTSVGVSAESGPELSRAPPATEAGNPRAGFRGPDGSMREALMEEVERYENTLKGRGVDVRALRAEVGVQRILSTTALERLVKLRDAVRDACVTSEPLPPEPGGEAVELDLAAEVKAQRLLRGEKAWAAACVTVGVTDVGSATDEQLGALLDLLAGGE